jgi:hypothetical protein
MTFGGRSPNVRSLELGIFIQTKIPISERFLEVDSSNRHLRLDPQQTAIAIKRHINKQRKAHPNSLASRG